MRTRLLFIAAMVSVTLVAGCGGDDDDSGSSTTPTSSAPTPSTATSSSAAPTDGPQCGEQDLLDQLPEGSTMDKFTCAMAGDENWAAVQVNPGPTVFFLKWDGSSWSPMTSDEVCGTASAGLPQNLLDYCPST